MTRSRLIASILAVALTPLVSACSLGGADETASPIPDRELLRPGTLSVCTDPTRPPLGYRARDGVLRGFEIDLLTEVARRLDLNPVWVDVERDEIESSLHQGRCDLATSIAIRRDFLGGELTTFPAKGYLAAPLSLLVRDGQGPLAISGLCGLRIGVFAGTREEDVLRGYGDTCADRRLPRVRVVAVPSTPAALERLAAGRVDGVLAEHPVNEWFARRQTDRFDVAWILADELVFWAIGSRPGMDALSGALHGELLGMHNDGSFRELLERWGLDRTGAVPLPLT